MNSSVVAVWADRNGWLSCYSITQPHWDGAAWGKSIVNTYVAPSGNILNFEFVDKKLIKVYEGVRGDSGS